MFLTLMVLHTQVKMTKHENGFNLKISEKKVYFEHLKAFARFIPLLKTMNFLSFLFFWVKMFVQLELKRQRTSFEQWFTTHSDSKCSSFVLSMRGIQSRIFPSARTCSDGTQNSFIWGAECRFKHLIDEFPETDALEP